MTNRKLFMGFRSAQKSVTLNDCEPLNVYAITGNHKVIYYMGASFGYK